MALKRLLLASLTATLLPTTAAANQRADIVEGEVVRAASRWSADGSVIVTESVIRQADGTEVSVSQLGGRASGIRMRLMHGGAPPLSTGDYVAAQLAPGTTASGRSVMTVRKLVEPSLRHSFVQTTNDSNAPMHWAHNCVFIRYDAEGSSDIAGDREFEILDQSLAA